MLFFFAQVNAGLSFENMKEKYQYMFKVKTLKRIYYLVAKNKTDMRRISGWLPFAKSVG